MIDPVFHRIESHARAWQAVKAALHLNTSNQVPPVANKLGLEQTRLAFADLVLASRELATAEARTLNGLVRQLEYLAAALAEPGAPAMPLEIGTLDMTWESAFSTFCRTAASNVAGIVARAGSAEAIDAAADAIVIATGETFDDFAMARKAARAAFETVGLITGGEQ